MQNRPFRDAIQPVSRCQTAAFAMPNGTWHNALWAKALRRQGIFAKKQDKRGWAARAGRKHGGAAAGPRRAGNGGMAAGGGKHKKLWLFLWFVSHLLYLCTAKTEAGAAAGAWHRGRGGQTVTETKRVKQMSKINCHQIMCHSGDVFQSPKRECGGLHYRGGFGAQP